jgi:hypothetical protein
LASVFDQVPKRVTAVSEQTRAWRSTRRRVSGPSGWSAAIRRISARIAASVYSGSMSAS